ncbi:MAG: hypothetical protein QOH09_4202 [Pseudonocardiales bacterium]|nr:hypothetical protein [Pseudonocardiales bacterium]
MGLGRSRWRMLESAPTTTVDSPRSARTRRRKGLGAQENAGVEERSRWRWSLRYFSVHRNQDRFIPSKGPGHSVGPFSYVWRQQRAGTPRFLLALRGGLSRQTHSPADLELRHSHGRLRSCHVKGKDKICLIKRPNRSAVHHGGARRTPEVPVSADLATLAVSTLRGPTATGDSWPHLGSRT